jgi:two-component system CheB/CheR fusion protein
MQMADARQVFVRLQSEEIVRLPDLTFASKQGRQLEVDIICNIYLEGERRVGQFNIRDITDRKRFDQQLQQSAKLESLGLLAGGVAHDFNNLLTGIMGNAALVLDATPADSPDREALRDIVKSSQRAADLTRQMLAYSGRGRFIVRLTDFSELVRDISTLVRSSIPKSVDVELHLAAHLPCIEADATQIQQLVMNLVINGAEAIGEGRRGMVHVTTAEEQLDAETIKQQFPGADISPGRYVSLHVSDSGSGMDAVTQAKIFDPFFTTKFTGRGLGLAAALGIVKGHHGAIRVYSALGRGTTFKVVFPVSASEEKAAAPPPVSHEDLHGSGLVLVVDDEEMVRSLAAAALQRYGYQVLTAPNGEAALELVRERGANLALVILDLMMPLKGGEEALISIKEIRPDLPVILSSGYDEMHVAKQIDPSSLAGFVQKPYVIKSLLEAVKAAIRK